MRAVTRMVMRGRWLVVALWVVAAVGATVAGQTWGGAFSNDLSVSGSDSARAAEVLAEDFPELAGDGMQVVIHRDEGVTGRQVRRAVEESLAEVATHDGVAAVASPYAEPSPMVSADGSTAVATVRFTDPARDLDPEQIEAVERAMGPVLDAGAGVDYVGSARSAESGPSGSEVIGLAAAVVVLLVAFGSYLAMLVPIVTAVLALALGLGLVHLVAGQTAVGTSGPVVAAMIGLGVGIDYALLVVTRHREGLAEGLEIEESVETALATAGRSVLVAGTAVVVAILSLYLIGIPFVATLGLASAITVGATLLAAVTLLPAVLRLLGRDLDRYRLPRRRSETAGRAGWRRWTRRVQRRPVPFLLGALVLLTVMAAPLADLRLGTADASSAPSGSTERRAYDLVAEGFGPGWTGPLLVTVSGPDGGVAAGAADLAADLRTTPGVVAVTPPQVSSSGDSAVLTVVPEHSPDAAGTEALVHRLRSDRTGWVHVGGPTALAIDLADTVEERLPLFIGFIVLLSALLLLVEFRSVFVPVKAAVMNLLSVGAAYGAVVAVFQWGWGADLLGVEPGPVESFAPMMLFAVLFGLSMDYEVFLLSRVKEEYLASGDPAGAVAEGVAATARVITAAASVMVVVFASFQLNDERVVKLFGFGLAVAIALDATVVRLVLVPAVMAVAGRRAWWLPRRRGRRRAGPAAAHSSTNSSASTVRVASVGNSASGSHSSRS